MSLDQNSIEVQVKLKVAEIEANIRFLQSLGRINELAGLSNVIQSFVMGHNPNGSTFAHPQKLKMGSLSGQPGFTHDFGYTPPNYNDAQIFNMNRQNHSVASMVPELSVLFDEIKTGNCNRLFLTKQLLIEAIPRQGYIFYTNNNKEEIGIQLILQNVFYVFTKPNKGHEYNSGTYTSVVEAVDKFLELLSKKEENCS